MRTTQKRFSVYREVARWEIEEFTNDTAEQVAKRIIERARFSKITREVAAKEINAELSEGTY